MSYDPKANIFRFAEVYVNRAGEVLAVLCDPDTKERTAFDEGVLSRWLLEERQHLALMPVDLKFNATVQISELNKAMVALQSFKQERGIPLDTPRFEPEKLPGNVSVLPIPEF